MTNERMTALQVGAVAVVELLGREHIAHTKTLDDLKITQNEEKSLHHEIEEQRSVVEAKNAVIERLRSELHDAKMAVGAMHAPSIEKALKMLEALIEICSNREDDAVSASLIGQGMTDVCKALKG